jgi:hypothetical protein
MHPRGPVFFPWRGQHGFRIFGDFGVPYGLLKFPMYSQYVPQVPSMLPKMFPITPHFYPITFAYYIFFLGVKTLIWGMSKV